MAKMNRYDRGKNKRALQRKERAKAKNAGHSDAIASTDDLIPALDENTIEETGIVCTTQGWHVSVMSKGEVIECKPDPKLSLPSASPKGLFVVGDLVGFRRTPKGTFVTSRADRKSVLARLRGDAQSFSAFKQERHVLAANVDLAVIVASSVDPPFHPNLVDRYLILCAVGNIAPAICVTKADLQEKLAPAQEVILDWYRSKLQIPVFRTSAVTSAGLELLAEHLLDKMAVFVGNSGVGKSTLIRSFTRRADIRIQDVSAATGQGRHTTTSSDLYEWSPNSFLIDTPGIRNLDLGYLPRRQLRDFFPDFDAFQPDCHFSDCIHESEPGCKVRQAVIDGQIIPERYEGYLAILNDLV